MAKICIFILHKIAAKRLCKIISIHAPNPNRSAVRA